MSNLLEILKDIIIDINSDQTLYVYYDKNNGSIIKINSRYKDTHDYKILKVPYSQVEEIMTGSKKLEDFTVVYDLSAKSYIIKENTYEHKLVSIEKTLYQLPVYKRSIDVKIENTVIFEEIYENVDVFVYVNDQLYYNNSLLWFNNSVYKLKKDVLNDFCEIDHEIYITDVLLTDFKSNVLTTKYNLFETIYSGVFVDVWYNNLPHLAGQHVWNSNNVYRIKTDQSSNTDFELDNVELILENVQLYDDANKSLNFIKEVQFGDKLLINNFLYLYSEKNTVNQLSNKFIKFYINPYTFLINTDNLHFVKLTNVNNKVDYETCEFDSNLHPAHLVNNGQKILIGKNLYIAKQTNENVDITVLQNYDKKCWNIILNRVTRKTLLESGYKFDDRLVFSITAKYDPNILYRTIEFTLNDLINEVYKNYPFIYDWEFNKENVSIYTPKYFETYAHEILE